MRPRVPCLALVLSLAAAPSALAGPEIFSIEPESGPAGTHVSLKGKGLAKATHVAFAVGRTVKPARFKVVSDRELEVIAPEYYRPQAAATVAVFTRTAATVAMPAAAQAVRGPVRGSGSGEPGAGFYHVLGGGSVARAGSVALIERGGVVERGDAPGMHFVRHGGALLDYENPNGIVFHEPGAIFGPQIYRTGLPLTFVTIHSLSVSPGVGPFRYEGAPRPDPGRAPAVPPEIRAIEPFAAAAGDVVTLRGRGLARTTSVLCAEAVGIPRPAGFRIVSDEVLKVEVPDESPRAGPQALIVLGTEGMTVTVAEDRLIRAALPRPLRPTISPTELPFYWVGPGDSAESLGGGAIVFIESGGVLTPSGGGLTFVKRGGQVFTGGFGDRVVAKARGRGAAGPVSVYYEPGATLPEALKARSAQEVPRIVPSVLPRPFVVLPGPVFRR